MWYDVLDRGYGIFRVVRDWNDFDEEKDLWVWDDYEDDEPHDGYGILKQLYGIDKMEVMKIDRDKNGNPTGMYLVEYFKPSVCHVANAEC